MSETKPTNRSEHENPVEYWLNRALITRDGCLEVTACKDKDGYPLVWYGGRNGKLARLSRLVLAAHTDKPLKYFALHKCDNPACVNPQHLFEGTQKENRQDAAGKNRTAKGERNGKPRKLAKAEVLAIRKAKNTEAQIVTACRYGVHQVTISKIQRGETWTWL